MLERDQVLHVARLARLELTEQEVERMAAELSKVLDHIERIRELDLEDVPPTSHVVDVVNVLRADEPRPCLPAEVAVEAAPEPVRTEAGLGFGVPSPGAQ
jgi:aspartyl-tRNA(Asn)/glutamyl-tRNA(Gln) amidotransferase subunit C